MYRVRFDEIILFLLLFCFVWIKCCKGDGAVSVRLSIFRNSDHKLATGVCCDNQCQGDCDNYFEICVADLRQNCISNIIRTDDIANDYYWFGTHLDHFKSLENPVKLQFSEWSVNHTVMIKTFDKDHFDLKRNELVAMFIFRVQEPSQNESMALNEIRIQTSASSRLSIGIRSYCSTGYLIPHCNEHCIDKDDQSGHYRCDYKTGKKICLASWYGPSCLSKRDHCIPSNDTSGHFKCHNVTGDIICLHGWKNVTSNCTEKDVQQSTQISKLRTTKMSSYNPTSSTRLFEHITFYTTEVTARESSLQRTCQVTSTMAPKTLVSIRTFTSKQAWYSSINAINESIAVYSVSKVKSTANEVQTVTGHSLHSFQYSQTKGQLITPSIPVSRMKLSSMKVIDGSKESKSFATGNEKRNSLVQFLIYSIFGLLIILMIIVVLIWAIKKQRVHQPRNTPLKVQVRPSSYKEESNISIEIMKKNNPHFNEGLWYSTSTLDGNEDLNQWQTRNIRATTINDEKLRWENYKKGNVNNVNKCNRDITKSDLPDVQVTSTV